MIGGLCEQESTAKYTSGSPFDERNGTYHSVGSPDLISVMVGFVKGLEMERRSTTIG